MTVTRHMTRGIMHQAVDNGSNIFIGGIFPDNPKDSMYDQSRDVFQKLKDVMHELGQGLDSVLMVYCYLCDISQKQEMNRAWEEFFPGDRAPARVCPGIVAIEEGTLLEISAVATRGQ